VRKGGCQEAWKNQPHLHKNFIGEGAPPKIKGIFKKKSKGGKKNELRVTNDLENRCFPQDADQEEGERTLKGGGFTRGCC